MQSADEKSVMDHAEDDGQIESAGADPFAVFRGRKNLSEPHMKQAQIILAAVTEVVAPETTSVAYFGALMTALKQMQEQEQTDTLAAMLYLIGMLFPNIPANVLKSKFEDIARVFLGLLEAGNNAENAQIARPILACIGSLLQVQDLAMMSHRTAVQCFQALLIYSVDPRPKVRKAAQGGAVSVTQAISGACYLAGQAPFPRALAEGVRDLTLRELGQCTSRDADVALHLLSGYLSQCLSLLPRATVVAPICHALLSLCRTLSSHSILHLQTMRCLQSFFENAGPLSLESSSAAHALEFEANLSFIDTLLGSLLEQAPHPNEVSACSAFFQAVQAALVRLADPTLFSAHGVTSGRRLSSFISQLTDYLLSSKFEVIDAAANTAAQLLRACINAKMAQHTSSRASAEPTPIESIIVTLQSLLGYRYKNVWSQSLRVIDAGIEALGRHASLLEPVLAPLLVSLDQLHESEELLQDKAVRQLLERAVGTSVEKMGPAIVVSVLPLNLPGSDAAASASASFDQQLLQSRAWLLPLFQDHVSRSHLGFFWQHLHPVLVNLHTQRVAAQQENAPIRARAILALLEQIWAVFPSFCRLPTDLDASFKLMAKTLGTYLSSLSHSYAWLPICKGLQDLVLACAPEPDEDEDGEDGDDDDELSKASDSDSDDDDVANVQKQISALAASAAPKKGGNQKGGKPLDTLSVKSGKSALKSTTSRKTTASQRSAARIAAWSAKPKILRYSDADATANQAILAPFAKNFLPIFFNLVEKIAVEKRQQVLDVISAYAAIAEEKLLNSTFKNILKMLLQTSVQTVTNPSSSSSDSAAPAKPAIDMTQVAKVHMLSDIAYSLCDRLDSENTEWLYKTILPQLRDADPRLQKKSYKTLARLCSANRAFLAAHVEDLTASFSEALPDCAAGSKKSRLRCLRTLVQCLPSLSEPRVVQAFPVLLGEVILALKELSERSRAVAFDVLLSMADRMKQASDEMQDSDSDEDEDDGGKKKPAASASAADNLAPTGKASIREFFLMVVGGLAGASQHMKSGAVLALSRLLYEFADELPLDFVSALVETVCLLLKERSREVVKSVLGFVKVVLVTLSSELLQPHVKLLVEGLLLWSRESQSRFRMKTRVLLVMLIRRFGADAVMPFVPEDLQKWITNISKSERRSAKKKAAERAAKRQGDDSSSSSATATAGAKSKKKSFEDTLRDDDLDDYQDDDGLDSDDESSKKSGTKKATGAARVWLRDVTEETFDLLDPSMARHIMTSNPNRKSASATASSSSSSMFSVDERGRFVIPKNVIEEDSDDDSSSGKRRGGRGDDGMEPDSDDEVVAVGKGKVAKKRPVPSVFGGAAGSASAVAAGAAAPATGGVGGKRKGPADDGDAEMGDASAGDAEQKPFYLTKKAQERKDERERKQKKRKEAQSDGSLYRSSHASGDMKVKGRPDPYAFLPLDPAMLNRRNKHEAEHQFDNIVRAAHAGSMKGTQARDKWKKNNKRK